VRSNKVTERIDISRYFLDDHIAKYTFKGIGFEQNNLSILEESINISDLLIENNEITIDAPPVFFDQTPYLFSLYFPDAVDARIFSPLAQWCDYADWDNHTKRLTIPINFGNDLGDFELCWEWLSDDNIWYSGSLRAQVYSFKLDIQTHFQWMIHDVSERFNWLRLDFLRQTTWGWSHDESADANLDTWLTIFQDVRTSMGSGFTDLIEQHRRRLMPDHRMLRAEQIRRVSPRNEERVVESIRDNPLKRFSVKRKALDANTPENQYMKYILIQTLSELNGLIEKISGIERISSVFKERIQEWSDEWSLMSQNRFWKGIGDFHGLKRESMVLTQDPLYAGIRRSWYWLQKGLQFLEHEFNGGIQNVAQLYEVWCLVKIDRLLQNNGWNCIKDEGINFELLDDDWKNDETRTGAAKLSYTKSGFNENISLDLLFQPTAGKKPSVSQIWDGMMSVPVVQKPDIVLRLHRNDLPNCPVYTWIFDAKYRLNGNNAPDDAVNQMHRYRDAILWSEDIYGKKSHKLTRESIGAYVLYPGDESKSDKFPQIDSINRTNIGAYPLLPTSASGDFIDDKPSQLNLKLQELLSIKKDFNGVMEQEINYYSSVPLVKKPSIGIICIATIRTHMDNQDYWQNCRLYRLPLKQLKDKFTPPEKWQYIAPQNLKGKHYGLFPIHKYEKLNRKTIFAIYENNDIYIDNKLDQDNEPYLLFYLGEPIDAPENLELLKKNVVVTAIEY